MADCPRLAHLGPGTAGVGSKPLHAHAVDAMLSATALTAPGPVTVLTSAPEDLAALCGGRATVIKV